MNGKEGVVGIPFFDRYVEKASLDYDGQGAPEPSNTSPAVPS